MFTQSNIFNELVKLNQRSLREEDLIIEEVNKIYSDSLFNKRDLLNNLSNYNNSFSLLNETDIETKNIFSLKALKKICVRLRLKFLDIEDFKGAIPYEAQLKINSLNKLQGKDLKVFKILADEKSFAKENVNAGFALFARTVYGNYYLIHSWGGKLKWYKKITAFPLRNFESLVLSLICFTLIVTLSLPTYLITLDKSATYFCNYRIGVYFHLLIFFGGFSAYYIVGFKKGFSESCWLEK